MIWKDLWQGWPQGSGAALLLLYALACAVATGLVAAEEPDQLQEDRAKDRRVRVYNETSQVMVEFFASNAGRAYWQDDLLGPYSLPPGGSVLMSISDGTDYCEFDVKAVFDDGDAVYKSRINVCQFSSIRITDQ